MASLKHLPAGRQRLVEALTPYAVPDTRVGLRLFIVDVAVYAIGMGLALFEDGTFWRVVGAVIVGLKMGSVYTLAHDALHHSLTASRRLNKLIAATGYLLSLHNYRIRLFDHLVLGHHPKLNGSQPDVYQPMSWEAYQQAPWWRQAWERYVRSPQIFAFAPYGIVSRWLEAELLPNKAMPAIFRARAYGYGLLLLGSLSLFVGWLAIRNDGDAAGLLSDIALVLVLPFVIFQTLQAAILFFQHTHPSIPWFGPGDPQFGQWGPEALTVHVELPKWLSSLTHEICEHPAHHVVPSIPCYRLREAQARLNELLGDRSLRVRPSYKVLADIMRRCKVYDYEHHVWLDFKGRPTAVPISEWSPPASALPMPA